MLPRSLQRLFTPRARFALWVLAGLGALALPTTELWRRQSLELQAALDARRSLPPIALVVQTQRALLAHRPYAAAVLSGRAEQEAERLRRQQAVDGDVAALGSILEVQRLHRALAEADHLRDEWSAVLEGIGAQRLSAAASDTAHDLLVEQTFVITDLIGAIGLKGQAGRAIDGNELAFTLHVLPRFALALADRAAAAAPAGAATAFSSSGARLRAQARRTAAAAAELLAAIDAQTDRAADAALVRSLVALRQSAEPLSRAALADAASTSRALAATAQASGAMLAQLDARLGEAIAALRLERRLLAAAGLVAMLVAALAAALAVPWRGAGSPRAGTSRLDEGRRPATALDTSAGQLGGENESPANHLLERLRRGTSERFASDPPDTRPQLPR